MNIQQHYAIFFGILFLALAGNVTCQCGEGFTGDETDVFPCTQCEAGKYTSSTAKQACEECGRGKYAAAPTVLILIFAADTLPKFISTAMSVSPPGLLVCS